MATNEEGCRTIYFVVRLAAAYLSFRRCRRRRRRLSSLSGVCSRPSPTPSPFAFRNTMGESTVVRSRLKRDAFYIFSSKKLSSKTRTRTKTTTYYKGKKSNPITASQLLTHSEAACLLAAPAWYKLISVQTDRGGRHTHTRGSLLLL